MYDMTVTASCLVTTHSDIKKTWFALGVTMCLVATLCPQISLQHDGHVTPLTNEKSIYMLGILQKILISFLASLLCSTYFPT